MVLVGCFVLVAGCDSDLDGSPPDPRWRAVTLPLPAGGPGRPSLRDAAVCAGQWYAVGAVVGADGATRPGFWISADGVSWQSVTAVASTGYGAENTLYSVGCRTGGAVAIGARSGGVHGNPRVSSWRLEPGGSLVEVSASFALFGGDEALNVARVAGGSGGYLIAGNRVSGAAVWTSADGTEFTLRDGVVPLASDSAGVTWAADVVSGPEGWTVVGALTPSGRIDRDPVAWFSADGLSWRRDSIDGGGDNEDLRRVAVVPGGLLAVGLRGTTFGAWHGTGGVWRPVGRFGEFDDAGVPEIYSLAAGVDGVLVCVGDGRVNRLFRSSDGGGKWWEIASPAGDDTPMVVTETGGQWLLLAADGRAWTAR